MKFKKGDRVEYIGCTDVYFTKGKIYIVSEDGLDGDRYLDIEEDDQGDENGLYPDYFKLIEENKMKTDNKTMAEIWREIENNPDAEIETNAEFIGWTKFIGFVFNPEKYLYRIKPKTIMVNGVEIPKPLDVSEINDGARYYYMPCYSSQLCHGVTGYQGQKYNYKLLYETEEEAIEASKALFGIED